jgi:flagellin
MSVINTNLNALVSQESSRASGLKLSQSMERLSTGSRINSAKDDAAGLSISNRMTSQVRGIQMAVRNSNDAISMTQTAEGAYGQVNNMLQRMRELAVQASSGTMSNDDRSSLQLEVTQLTSEIDHIAKTTNFNNINLLDGTAKKVIIQTGANQKDKIEMSFDSVRANNIGSDIQPSLTSASGTSAQMGTLTQGDLVLNGVSVGVSFAEDDTLSSTGNSASSIAKVAAINRLSDESGVIAKAAVNTVSGTAMTALATTGTITINGYSSTSITTTTDASLSRQLVTDAINAMSKATGVTATNTGSDNGGVVLTAADGRNIAVSLGDLTAAATGVAASDTYIGSYDLYSKDGSAITVGSREGASSDEVGNAGLRIGTYEGGIAQTMTRTRATVDFGETQVSAATGVLNGDTLVINGIAIGSALATDDTASYLESDTSAVGSQRAGSAIAIAAAINKQTERTGVTAEAQANVLRGESFTAASTTGTVSLNGVSITIDTSDINNVIDTFNEYSGQTGVVASRFGDALELRAEDGRNISIGVSVASASNLGLGGLTMSTNQSATTHYATVALKSEESFTVESGYEGVTNFEALGFRRGTFGGASGDKISSVDISTQQGANDALRAIDAAINQVSNAQAKSGALNNRLDAIVNNLSEGLQNMSASRSRILDTDYATETTELAKQQIIQQASTAMLAQANQGAQGVLALLK